MLRGFLLDAISNEASVIEIKDELKEFYRILNCDYIDIIHRNVKGRDFTVVCDDMGLLRSPVRISAIDINGQPALAGSLFFVHDGPEGEFASLEEGDAEHLFSCVRELKDFNVCGIIKVITGLNY